MNDGLLRLISSLVGFGISFIASALITQSWLKRSHVLDFDRVLTVRVLALTPRDALITYETNVVHWNKGYITVYNSTISHDIFVPGAQEKALIIDTSNGWYGIMGVPPQNHVLQQFDSLIESLTVSTIFFEAKQETNVMNIVNALLCQNIIQK